MTRGPVTGIEAGPRRSPPPLPQGLSSLQRPLSSGGGSCVPAAVAGSASTARAWPAPGPIGWQSCQRLGVGAVWSPCRPRALTCLWPAAVGVEEKEEPGQGSRVTG